MRLRISCIFLGTLLFLGCAQTIRSGKTDVKDRLLDNMARDIAEINLMVETARSSYQLELMSFRVLESWTLFPDTEIRNINPNKAKIYNVLQKSMVEISSSDGPTTIHMLKIQGDEGVFIGIERPGRVGTYHMGIFSEEQVSGQLIRFYDGELAQDEGARKSVRQYVMVTTRMEKAASLILKKLMELHNKYKTTQIQIQSFHVNFPVIAIDIQFKFKSTI